jgi:hypothetical protein
MRAASPLSDRKPPNSLSAAGVCRFHRRFSLGRRQVRDAGGRGDAGKGQPILGPLVARRRFTQPLCDRGLGRVARGVQMNTDTARTRPHMGVVRPEQQHRRGAAGVLDTASERTRGPQSPSTSEWFRSSAGSAAIGHAGVAYAQSGPAAAQLVIVALHSPGNTKQPTRRARAVQRARRDGVRVSAENAATTECYLGQG